MTKAELRLCTRWRKRDERYRQRVIALTPGELAAVRSWRIDEAEAIDSPALRLYAAREWHL